MADINVPPITIDLYSGAFGLTLRMDCPGREVLSKLRELFADLGARRATFVKLHEMEWVKLNPGLHGIYLKLSDKVKEPRGLVELSGKDGETRNCNLTRYSEGWMEWAEQLDPLLDRFDEPGIFQTLTGKYADDAVIDVVIRGSH